MKQNENILERSKRFFNRLNKGTMDCVDEFYDRNVVFIDPMVSFTDRQALKSYYTGLYQNVNSIHFTFDNEVTNGSACTFSWIMEMTCGLNKGKPMAVNGISTIRFGGEEEKAVYHRDYYDMGEFVYERIPVMKNMIKIIKAKMLAH